MMKKLPIGIEYFKDFKRDNFYYIDKTGFICDLVNTRGSVNLFTRPRRFGKSLNLNMLKTFFEVGTNDISLNVPTAKVGCVIEIKYAENGKFDQACADAMQQIEKCGYMEALRHDGMHVIHGIACYKKTAK